MSEAQDDIREESTPLTLADRLRNLAIHQMKDLPMTSDQMETWISQSLLLNSSPS